MSEFLYDRAQTLDERCHFTDDQGLPLTNGLQLSQPYGNAALLQSLELGSRPKPGHGALPGHKFDTVVPGRGDYLTSATAMLCEPFTDDDRHEEYTGFVGAMDASGMPSGFLKAVDKSISVAEGGNSVRYVCPQMTLNEGVFRAIDGILAGDHSGSSGLGTVYHESTHAYLNLMKDNPEVAALVQHGVSYYDGVPLQGDGGVVDDPKRVFDEAMATYVGMRAEAMWRTREQLKAMEGFYRDGRLTREQYLEEIREIRDDYNSVTSNRDYGYQERGAVGKLQDLVMGKGEVQLEVNKPISDEMKKFADEKLMEGKVPDDFDDCPEFSKYLAQ